MPREGRAVRLVSRIVVLLLLAACTDIVSTVPQSPAPPFRLSAADVWSDGQVRLYSTARLPDTLPAVTVGGVAVAASRLNDTTLLLGIPRAVGPQVIVVAWSTDTVRGTLTVHGFDSRGSLFGIWGVVTQLPGVSATVIGNGTTSMATADLRNGSVTPYADSIHTSACAWGPGVTSDSGRFILQAPPDTGLNQCVHSRWQVTPFLSSIERTPSFPLVGTDNHRVIAELAPRRWLVSEQDDFTLWVCDTGCVNTYAGTLPPDVPGRIDGVHLSPRHDRVALDEYGSGGSPGIPVLDATTATVAYRVPSLSWSEGAAYSPLGDTLFLAGGDSVSGGRTWMFALRAGTGLVLDSIPLAVRPGDVALDPGGSWIYVSGTDQSDHVGFASVAAGLEVLDRKTLQPVAVMRSDSLNVPALIWNKHRIVLDPANHQGYIVATDIFIKSALGSWPPSPVALVFGFTTP